MQYTEKRCLRSLTHKRTKSYLAFVNFKVITQYGDNSHFDIKARDLQDDTLAPYLFVIILDYIMRQTYKDRERRNLDSLYRNEKE